MIAVLDLGIGNLSSVRSGFARVGEDTVVVDKGEVYTALAAERKDLTGILLPGVGAFGDAMFQLRVSGLLGVVRQAIREGRPLLGICLGMQLLFSISEEHGSNVGLGVFPGRVVRFPNSVKVPHMGWNDLTVVKDHPLLRGVRRGDYVYFVHSYYAVPQEPEHLLAAAQYGNTQVPAVMAKGSTFGVQFHPEKSGSVGGLILANFVEICRAWYAAHGEEGRPDAGGGISLVSRD
ncbi:imidazole glycerol phosphate synthase subunit HisH [Alicyclobacillus contaminans]|uniref:imidazole glycerol phosphate synthase subunit HisH n=1 Tax=Alicyclobacillus contaminans TaxID=392016 RepID=UPI000418BDC9|nr:imidazole glycerol phosphate synthase subunit HisH [Alicyclobacillus contaminans]GMA49662.1 imidazole glycerol phosphate synthase subunit HisH [Alicyclobacillus contaminans]